MPWWVRLWKRIEHARTVCVVCRDPLPVGASGYCSDDCWDVAQW